MLNETCICEQFESDSHSVNHLELLFRHFTVMYEWTGKRYSGVNIF